eukprot:TRINITY_DN13866_c0_g1_i1.p1 TRINITY_DN13866_c0_g1~~TRINITY_DN13866_c0_g1_i1.p1  ORF type:complete len:348 (+),score=66.51 TRINITY_DN13866_c0_g1_i1:77-1120(+)
MASDAGSSPLAQAARSPASQAQSPRGTDAAAGRVGRKPAESTWNDALSHTVARRPQHGDILCIKGTHARAQLLAAPLKDDPKGLRRLSAFTLSRYMHTSFTGSGRCGGFRIGRSERFKEDDQPPEHDTIVGPGRYTPRLEAVLAQKGTAVRSVKMTKAERRLQGDEAAKISLQLPGVGDYEWSHLIAISRRRRPPPCPAPAPPAGSVRPLPHQTLPDGPGPQADWAPRPSVGGETSRQFCIPPRPPRFAPPAAGVLGPGCYEAVGAYDRCIRRRPHTARIDTRGWCRDQYSVRSRNDLAREQLTAGPGQYEARSAFTARSELAAFFKKAAEVRRRRAERPCSARDVH